MRTFRDLPRQQPNRFVNGFVEHLQGVLGYPNEPKNMQNGQYLGTEKEVSIRVKSEHTRTYLHNNSTVL